MPFLLLRFAALILASASGFFVAHAAPVEKNPAVSENFYGVEVVDDQAWIVGYYGTILHSNDRGLTWRLQSAPTRNALFNVHFAGPRKGWIGGSYGAALATIDGGKSWRPMPVGTQEHLFAAHWLDDHRGWMAGSRGLTLRTEDGGRSWRNLTLPGDFTFNGLAFVDAARGWLAGEFGVIFHTRDGGKSWRKQKSPVEISFASGASQNLFALLFSAPTQGYAFGLDGLVLRTVDGARWEIARQRTTQARADATHHLFAAAATRGRIFAVGERGTLLQAGSAGGDWQPAKLLIPRLSLNGIAFAQDGFGLAVGNRGLVLRSEDGGQSWQRLAIGLRAAATNGGHAP